MTHRSAALVAIVGGAMMAIGSFMPWISARTGFGSVDVAGTEGDGVATLIAGALAALIALVFLDKPAPGLAKLAIGAAGVIALVVVYLDYNEIQKRLEGITSDAVAGSVGAGLYIVGIGAVAAIIGAIKMTNTASIKPTPPAEPPSVQ
jgi:hypothetical protein